MAAAVSYFSVPPAGNTMYPVYHNPPGYAFTDHSDYYAVPGGYETWDGYTPMWHTKQVTQVPSLRQGRAYVDETGKTRWLPRLGPGHSGYRDGYQTFNNNISRFWDNRTSERVRTPHRMYQKQDQVACEGLDLLPTNKRVNVSDRRAVRMENAWAPRNTFWAYDDDTFRKTVEEDGEFRREAAMGGNLVAAAHPMSQPLYNPRSNVDPVDPSQEWHRGMYKVGNTRVENERKGPLLQYYQTQGDTQKYNPAEERLPALQSMPVYIAGGKMNQYLAHTFLDDQVHKAEDKTTDFIPRQPYERRLPTRYEPHLLEDAERVFGAY